MSQAATHHSLLVKKSTPMGRFLVVSVVGHVALLAAAVLYNAITSPPPIDLDQKPIKATLVRKGKARDEHLLPRKEELPPPPKEVKGSVEPVAAPAPTPVAVPVPGLTQPEPAKTQKQSGESSGEDRRKRLFGAFDRTSKKTNLDELEGADDGDALGDSATQEGERYFGLLSAQIRRHYDVSDAIPESDRLRLKAVVRMVIARSGSLVKSHIVKSSGNAVFDNAVLVAVKKASPFSPPPDHLRDMLQKNGIPIEFSP